MPSSAPSKPPPSLMLLLMRNLTPQPEWLKMKSFRKSPKKKKKLKVVSRDQEPKPSKIQLVELRQLPKMLMSLKSLTKLMKWTRLEKSKSRSSLKN